MLFLSQSYGQKSILNLFHVSRKNLNFQCQIKKFACTAKNTNSSPNFFNKLQRKPPNNNNALNFIRVNSVFQQNASETSNEK